jgi:hypothetical protein
VVEPFSDYSHVMYSSASSTEEHPKFRIILELDREVQAAEITHLWYAVNKEFGEVVDVQTKDKSRMYYTPALYPDSFWFFHSQGGKVVSVDELKEKHPYFDKTQLSEHTATSALGNDFKSMMQRMKRSSMRHNIDKFVWTTYEDCPFVTSQMLSDYSTICESGWYHQMYRMMVSIASLAQKHKYPITAREIEQLMREVDASTGNWYKHRRIDIEAQRAIDFVNH